MALPTMNQAIATVSPVTKSRPRFAEWSTSSAMPARPAGTSAASVAGSRLDTASSTAGREPSGAIATRTRSTSPKAFDISSSGWMSTTTPPPSANHLSDWLSAIPTTVIRRMLRRANMITSSPIRLSRPSASAASSTISSAASHGRPDVSESRPAVTSAAASTPTATSRTRFSPTRRSVGRKNSGTTARTPGMSASRGSTDASKRPPPRAEMSIDGTPSTVSASRR